MWSRWKKGEFINMFNPIWSNFILHIRPKDEILKLLLISRSTRCLLFECSIGHIWSNLLRKRWIFRLKSWLENGLTNLLSQNGLNLACQSNESCWGRWANRWFVSGATAPFADHKTSVTLHALSPSKWLDTQGIRLFFYHIVRLRKGRQVCGIIFWFGCFYIPWYARAK